MVQAVLQALEQYDIAYQTKVPMHLYTTFKTGGPADLLVEPKNIEQIAQAILCFKENSVPYFVMGGGANLLVLDAGIKGAVLMLGKAFSAITVSGNQLVAQAGAKLSALVPKAHQHGLIGLEFAAGIPGTVGGGVYMNAGAYGGELSKYISCVCTMDEAGALHTFYADTLQFGYRKSPFMENGHIIVSCMFTLPIGDVAIAKAHVKDISQQRKAKQPLIFASAGSTFKRPEGGYASALIEQCGLKGFRIGGAMVSEKHAGFIINYDHATSADIVAVIEHVQAVVKEKTGVCLQKEVQVVGSAI